jgi:anti-sigma factor RsiW
MRGSELTLAESGPHDQAEELLPWYATGQLDEHDRQIVEKHLYDCGECRRQLEVERQLARDFKSMRPEIESGWARLSAKLEPPSLRKPAPAPARFLSMFKQPAFRALAAAQLAVVVVAGAAITSLSRPDYHVLGSKSAPATANVIAMFRADTSEAQLRVMLGRAGASIVRGPTAAGAYLLHVEPNRRQAALAKLRADSHVEMAEAIDGATR